MRVKVIRKPCRFLTPNSNLTRIILKLYRYIIRRNDFIIISDKALSTAYGYIYDEARINADLINKAFTYLTSRIFWGKIFYKPFSNELLHILREADIELLTKHKKLALIYGGVKHVIKPVSEAGIDTTNLPYNYVSLPIPLNRLKQIIDELYEELNRNLNKDVNVLVIDTDKTFKPKTLNSIAFSTRPSNVKGIIDLGGIAYFIGKRFRSYFYEYPTPVDYRGTKIGLNMLLQLSGIVEKFRGYGLGRNIREVTLNLGYQNYSAVKWRDLLRVKHYPIVIARICT